MNLKETIIIKSSNSFLVKINNKNRDFIYFHSKENGSVSWVHNHHVVEKIQKLSNYWVVLLRGKLSDSSDFDLSFTEIAWRNFSTP